MYARVPQAMAQFVPKIEKFSHIMGPTPILEMARAYGLHPRSWLLVRAYGGWGESAILVRHNLSIIPPAEHNFEHNTLVSQVTPDSIILYFSNIIRQTLLHVWS